jgi:hypothetical protein
VLIVFAVASKETMCREIDKKSQFNEREDMRQRIIVLACTLIASLAFAQVSTTNTAKTSTTGPVNTEKNTLTTAVGTVSKFTPGQTIVVQTSPSTQPMSYVIGKTVRYVNAADKEINPETIREGNRVRLDFNKDGAVERVVVED